MNREEHMKWCKERALAEIDRGDLSGAVASMASDLTKHDETKAVANPSLMMLGMMDAAAGNSDGVRRWIEGFAD